MTLMQERPTEVACEDRVAIARIHAIGNSSDELVTRVENLGKQWNIGRTSEKSPFKNVLAVSAAPGASLKVLQNFILYQLGRTGGSRIWQESKQDLYFAQALVKELDALHSLRDKVAEEIRGLTGVTLQQDQKQALHLRLAQLFLGYLSRYHTAQSYLTKNAQGGGHR